HAVGIRRGRQAQPVSSDQIRSAGELAIESWHLFQADVVRSAEVSFHSPRGLPLATAFRTGETPPDGARRDALRPPAVIRCYIRAPVAVPDPHDLGVVIPHHHGYRSPLRAASFRVEPNRLITNPDFIMA